jgi:hypothetical protein
MRRKITRCGASERTVSVTGMLLPNSTATMQPDSFARGVRTAVENSSRQSALRCALSVNDTPGFLGLTRDGQVAVAGTTDSADFPVTAGAFQAVYAGPSPALVDNSELPPGGDLFAAILDPATGSLQSATFLGGTNPDTLGAAAIGTDGSLYFLPDLSTGSFVAGMPVTPGALQSACQGNPCQNSYAAHLSPGLDQLLYGTYLPGLAYATGQLYSDGSVYYAGSAPAGFPTTPNAYQPQNTWFRWS